MTEEPKNEGKPPGERLRKGDRGEGRLKMRRREVEGRALGQERKDG